MKDVKRFNTNLSVVRIEILEVLNLDFECKNH